MTRDEYERQADAGVTHDHDALHEHGHDDWPPRILRFADHLEQQPPERFDMNSWFTWPVGDGRGETARIVDLADLADRCGTTACIAGHTILWAMRERIIDVDPLRAHAFVPSAAARLLTEDLPGYDPLPHRVKGIAAIVADHLDDVFYDWYDITSPAEGAERLREVYRDAVADDAEANR